MRASGILMPVFSLPENYGIGTLGNEAYKFIDFLSNSGQKYWQILPLGPTSYGDSPYQSYSSFAGNPYFIDLELLKKEGLLEKSEIEGFDFGNDPNYIDYSKLYNNRYTVLKIAFSRFTKNNDYENFFNSEKHWLLDFALFMALKSKNGGIPWYNFSEDLKHRNESAIEKIRQEYALEIEFQFFIQYEFFKQYRELKNYANFKGIKIIGDIPIYTSFDSADVWSSPSQFLLDENLNPTLVAGCPPDSFVPSGQLWGNPLYNWTKMKNDGFSFWKKRLDKCLKMYDVVRIDHFRAFESYFAIPFGSPDARNGHWEKGPGRHFFDEIRKCFGENLPIIAEDLGHITPEVESLLEYTGFPGMKIMQFGFSGDYNNPYLPQNYKNNCVVYLGTHDNPTTRSWFESLSHNEKCFLKNYLNEQNENNIIGALINAALNSAGDTVILTVQDLLNLKDEARINTPGAVGQNWKWRMSKDILTKEIEQNLYKLTKNSVR